MLRFFLLGLVCSATPRAKPSGRSGCLRKPAQHSDGFRVSGLGVRADAMVQEVPGATWPMEALPRQPSSAWQMDATKACRGLARHALIGFQGLGFRV